MLKTSNGKIIIGFDLGDEFSQISHCFVEENTDVETLSSVAGEENYSIPTVLCKKRGVNQWFFGKEAIRFARENEEEGILVDDLMTLAREGEMVQIEGVGYEPTALLALYMKRCMGMLTMIPSTDKIVAMMITCRNLDGKMVEALNKTTAALNMRYTRMYYQNYTESFYYYMIYQPRELWVYQTVLFDLHSGQLSTMCMECNKRTTPIVSYIHEDNRPIEIPDSEADKEFLDEQFFQAAAEICNNRPISSIYLIGEQFSQDWMHKSLQYLCRGRRVFQGNNLYSKGACFCLLDKHFGSEAGKEYVFLGNDKLKSNIGMEVMHQGKDAYFALLDAGVNWYEAECECQFYLKEDASFDLTITPLIHGSVWTEHITLDGFDLQEEKQDFERAGREKCPIARIGMRMYLTDEDTLHMDLWDLGFGEIRPATDRNWHKTVVLSGEAIR